MKFLSDREIVLRSLFCITHLCRACNGVHLRRVSRRGRVGSAQRSRRTVRALLRNENWLFPSEVQLEQPVQIVQLVQLEQLVQLIQLE